MEKPVIMSKEFQEALQREINTIGDVILEWREDENLFDFEDYVHYHNDLAKLKDWLITE